jgi:hypothetical protein
MNYYVYLLIDPRNNKIFYCGKGKGDRWKSHLGHWSGNGKNNPTENKIRKMQREGFQPKVKFHRKNLAEDQAYSIEEKYIERHFDSLTNLKISAKPPSAKGRVGWSKGKKLSASHRKAISKGLLGHKRGSYNEAHRKAISESLKGKNHPMWGKPNHRRTPIIETTTGRHFACQTDAADILKIKQGDIANCLAGRQKSTKGYQFSYNK